MEQIIDQPQTQNTYITAQTPYTYQSLYHRPTGSHKYYIWNQDGHLFHKWRHFILINWKLGNIIVYHVYICPFSFSLLAFRSRKVSKFGVWVLIWSFWEIHVS